MARRRISGFPPQQVPADVPLEPLDELPCPVCGRTLQVARRAGVSLDHCPGHGVWLDTGELERLLEAAWARGRRTALARAQALAREARWSGHWALAGLVELLGSERRRAVRAARRAARR